jgi:excisionase family DNA binding protein
MPVPSPTASPRPQLTRDDVLDARQVADLLHLPLSTALEFARRGVLPGHKLGRRWIFLRDEIEAGVRHAHNTHDRHRTPEPSARNAEDRARRDPIPYPEAVPRESTPSQSRLFA